MLCLCPEYFIIVKPSISESIGEISLKIKNFCCLYRTGTKNNLVWFYNCFPALCKAARLFSAKRSQNTKPWFFSDNCRVWGILSKFKFHVNAWDLLRISKSTYYYSKYFTYFKFTQQIVIQTDWNAYAVLRPSFLYNTNSSCVIWGFFFLCVGYAVSQRQSDKTLNHNKRAYNNLLSGFLDTQSKTFDWKKHCSNDSRIDGPILCKSDTGRSRVVTFNHLKTTQTSFYCTTRDVICRLLNRSRLTHVKPFNKNPQNQRLLKEKRVSPRPALFTWWIKNYSWS